MTFFDDQDIRCIHYALAKQSGETRYWKTFQADPANTTEEQEVGVAIAEWFQCWALGTYQLKQSFVDARASFEPG